MRYFHLCTLLLALFACSTHNPEVDVACEIDNQNNYLLKWETMPRIKGQVEIYQSAYPNQFDTKANPVATADIKNGYIILPETNPLDRNYFLLRFKGQHDYIVGPRAESMDNIENFRDLGGYESRDGKQIQWGKIFRSGEFSTQLTSSEIIRINNMRIQTLIDFRDFENLTAYPPLLNIENIIHLPGAIHYQQNFRPRLEKDELLRGDANLFMQDVYVAMVSGSTNSLKSMFNQLLIEDNYPVVLSCINGKDYTGFAVSMLLHALDIPEEVIMEDYLLSNIYFDKRYTTFKADTCCEATQEALSLIQSANSRFLSYAHEYIGKQYGSIDNYLESELGVTTDKRNRLKQIILY